jgi:hypothetical protein
MFEKDFFIDLEIKKGQEYRLTNNAKYIWLNPVGYENIKVYKQLKLVKYADYRIGRYYIGLENVIFI